MEHCYNDVPHHDNDHIQCSICGITKYYTEFKEYHLGSNPHFNTCMVCRSAMGRQPVNKAKAKAYAKKHNQLPEVKARAKERAKELRQRPGDAERRAEYLKEYNRRPEVKAKALARGRRPNVVAKAKIRRDKKKLEKETI